MSRHTEEEAMHLFCSIAVDSEVAQADAKQVGPASRALSLAYAAIRAWKENRIFKLVGMLEPVRIEEAQGISRVAGEWVEILEQKDPLNTALVLDADYVATDDEMVKEAVVANNAQMVRKELDNAR